MPWTPRTEKAGASPPLPEFRRHRDTATRHRSTSTFIVIVLLLAISILLAITLPAGSVQKFKLWSGFQAEQDWNAESSHGDEYLIGVGKADITG